MSVMSTAQCVKQSTYKSNFSKAAQKLHRLTSKGLTTQPQCRTTDWYASTIVG